MVPPPPLAPATNLSLLPLLARRARFFRVGSDRVLTLPGRGGTLVLVPRGHGDPVLGTERGGQYRELRTGVACSAVRWEPAGAVAAWLREVAAPRPSVALGPVALRAGAVTLVRVHRLALTAAGVGEGGPACVATAGRVRAANAAALALGVGPGSPVRAAERARVAVHAPGDERAALDRLGAALEQEFGACERVRGGFLIAGGPDGSGDSALATLVHLRARIWQSTGLTVKVVSGPDARSIATLGRHLPASQVAVIPAGCGGLWTRLRRTERVWTGADRGGWEGTTLVDVEGVVNVAQTLVWAGVRGQGTRDLRLRLWTERGVMALDVRVSAQAGRTAVYSRVEVDVRRALGGGASVWAVAWQSLPQVAETVGQPEAARPRQVSLWA